MLDIHELNIFLVAAEKENFSEAARQLHLTQPAVSMQIQSLEKRLGVQLFIRSGRNVALSEAGHALVPMARDVVNMSQRIEETMTSLQGQVTGHLKIGCSTTAGKYILPHLVAKFRNLYPRTRVSIEIGNRSATVEKLVDGTVNLAVVSIIEPHRDIEYRSFYNDHVVLVVPITHPWARRRSITPDELVGAEFIFREQSSGTQQAMMEGLAEHGIGLRDLNVVMELANSEAIEMAVEAGIGVAFVSKLAASRGRELGRVRVVPVEGMELTRHLYIATCTRRQATRVQSEFWTFAYEMTNNAAIELAA